MEKNCTESLHDASDELCLRRQQREAAKRLFGATVFATATIGWAVPVSIPLGLVCTAISWRNFTHRREAVKAARREELIDKATYKLPAREPTNRQPTARIALSPQP